MQCPVCLENFTSINILSCSHPLCSECRQNWRHSCPLCRNNSHILSVNNITETICKLPRYPSVKNFSKDITAEELIILNNIFGNLTRINFLAIDIGYSILYQNFKSNHWWYGIITSINNDTFSMKNCIYYNRNNGNIYKATPSVRTLTMFNNDTVFVVK